MPAPHSLIYLPGPVLVNRYVGHPGFLRCVVFTDLFSDVIPTGKDLMAGDAGWGGGTRSRE